MAKKPTNSGDHPLRETEEAAYHAFREWPVFLVKRQKELEAHQALLGSSGLDLTLNETPPVQSTEAQA